MATMTARPLVLAAILTAISIGAPRVAHATSRW